MSGWDGYIDNLIGHSKDAQDTHIDKGGIFSLQGGAQWTTEHAGKGIVPQGSEMVNIAKCLETSKFDPFQTSGIILEGVKYQFLRVQDDKIVYGKKKGYGALTIQKSTTAIVVGHCKEGGQAGTVNKAVAVIAEYLESLNM